jgi:F-type H+-transporting ATPase subunit b
MPRCTRAGHGRRTRDDDGGDTSLRARRGGPPFQKETSASQLFWLVVCFAALYIMVSKLILPRMGTIIAERRDRIAGDLAEASRMKDEADGAVAAYEKALADARAQAIAAETRDKLNATAEANRKDLEAKLHGKLAEAEKTIAATKSAAMANVAGIAHEAVTAIVTHLTGMTPSPYAVARAVQAAARLDDLAQRPMQRLDGIGGVDHLADARCKREERHHVLPGSAPGLADRRIALART